MKQDYTRDYVTECFRYYAKGLEPSTEEEKADVIAVRETFAELFRTGKEHIVDAVRFVYMVEPAKPLSAKTIALRVRRLATTKGYADIRSVYRWLQTARQICAKKRGLRTESCRLSVHDS